MNATDKRYDSKFKVTRILLADYLALKDLAQVAGVSMAEALHEMITKDLARAEPREVVIPVTTVWSKPIATVRSIPVTRARLIPINTDRQRSMSVTSSFSREVETNGNRRID